MRKTAILSILIVGCAIVASALRCDECGEECRKACGTKQFKTCCFNYLRKRSMPDVGPDLRLEVSLANSQFRALGLPPYDPYVPYPPYASGPHSRTQETPESATDQGRLQLIYDSA